MAIAYARVATYGDKYQTITDITLDGSYGAGGYALTNASLGMLATPDNVVPQVITPATGLMAEWDKTNNKLKMWKTGSATSAIFLEAGAGDMSSATVVRVEATGKPIL